MRSVAFGVAGFLVVGGYPRNLQEYIGSRLWHGEWVLNSPNSIACLLTWVDRVTWLCFAGGAIVVLILLVR